ncbi:MAG: ABC transporter permease [Ferruginibacter sp.]|nr:ABC transporter permease [Cytophagales bacterium]
MLIRSSRFPARSVVRDWFFWLAGAYLGLFVAAALLAGWLPLESGSVQSELAHLRKPPFGSAALVERRPGEPLHWLGTDQLGRDVGIILVHGCRTALLVSLPAMSLAVGIGLALGGMAGYFGDRTVRISRAAWLALPLVVLGGYFYGFYLRRELLRAAFEQNAWSGLQASLTSGLVASLALIPGFWLTKGLQRMAWFRHRTWLPVDQAVLRTIELLSSVPNLVLVLLLASLTGPSLGLLVLVTGLTYWTEPARLVRAEILRIRALPYVESARAMGAPEAYILLRHALPNALPPVLVAFTFGVGRLMALESTLSFLGFGVPPGTPSWGRMINGMRTNPEAWWLAVFPGAVLCATVLALHVCSDRLLRRLGRRH